MTNYQSAADIIANSTNNIAGLLFQKQQKKEDAAAQLARDALHLKAQQQLQNESLVARAKELFDTQAFQGAQAEKSRVWQTGEREGGQDFTIDRDTSHDINASIRVGEERTFTAAQTAKQLAQQKLLADAQLAQQGGQFNQSLALQRDAQAYVQSPDNPANVSREAYAKRLLSQAGDFGDPATEAAPAQFGSMYEGKSVIGPDGKKYLIKNGQPVAQ